MLVVHQNGCSDGLHAATQMSLSALGFVLFCQGDASGAKVNIRGHLMSAAYT